MQAEFTQTTSLRHQHTYGPWIVVQCLISESLILAGGLVGPSWPTVGRQGRKSGIPRLSVLVTHGRPRDGTGGTVANEACPGATGQADSIVLP